MTLHRIPRKQLDTNIFYVNDDMDRIVGLGHTTAQVYEHLSDTGDLQDYHKASNIGFDPDPSPLTMTTVQHAVTEFANKPIANPVNETSAGVISVLYYRINATEAAYVGTYLGEDPNGMFAVYDLLGNELPITITDVTSDQGGTTSVIGSTWYDEPYLQLSDPPNQQIIVKYGTESTLAGLPINALLKEGVIVAEIDSEIIAAIAEIKGTEWDVAVPLDRNLVGLDARIVAFSPFLHVHRIGIVPTGAQDGVNAQYHLPGSDVFKDDTLEVFLNGNKIFTASVLPAVDPIYNDSFILDIETEQLPNVAVADTLEVSYILGP